MDCTYGRLAGCLWVQKHHCVTGHRPLEGVYTVRVLALDLWRMSVFNHLKDALFENVVVAITTVREHSWVLRGLRHEGETSLRANSQEAETLQTLIGLLQHVLAS